MAIAKILIHRPASDLHSDASPPPGPFVMPSNCDATLTPCRLGGAYSRPDVDQQKLMVCISLNVPEARAWLHAATLANAKPGLLNPRSNLDISLLHSEASHNGPLTRSISFSGSGSSTRAQTGRCQPYQQQKSSYT